MKSIIHKTLFNHRQLFPILSKKWNICYMTTNSNDSNNIKINSTKEYDVIIVGGAATGLSMASAMAKNSMLADKKILLLDGSPKFKGYQKDGFSNRVFALSKGTVELLKSIDAWETITSIRYKPVKQMQIWDACSDASITFNHDNFSEDMAYIVENDVLTYSILEEIKKTGNITMFNGIKIDKIQLPKNNNNSGQSSVTLSNGDIYNCNLLIGADGANSMVRKQMGYDNVQIAYNQLGVIATVELNNIDDNSVAWQRFLPNGVIALLPLSDNLSSIVWSTSINHAKELLKLPQKEFVDAVNEAFWKNYPKTDFVINAMKSIESFLGSYSQTVKQLPPNIKDVYENSRAAFPLNFGHTSTYVTDGVALIGDAAHRVHPLAGQGLNLGFGDVKCLTNVLANASYSGFSLGNINHLCTYEKQRLQHNGPIMIGIHGLQRLYNTDFSPIVLLRSMGLQAVQSIHPLKANDSLSSHVISSRVYGRLINKFFMEKAMS